MMSGIQFTSTELWFAAAAIFGLLMAVIYGMKTYMKRKASTNLTEINKGRVRKSPLDARTKYPEVDIFQYSSLFLRASFALVLGVTVLAFNWTTFEKDISIPDYSLYMQEDIEIEPPRSSVEPPPPPPPPPSVIMEVPPELIPEEDEVEFLDQSVDLETSIDDAPVAKEDNKVAAPPPPPPPPPPAAVSEIFKVVEQMPRYPGCEEMAGTDREKKVCADRKMLEFIYANIKYPKIARENGVEGMVVVQFVVDTDGKISEPKVIRDIGGGCGEEALRIVEMMPTWIPGKQRGRTVRVMFNLPIKFELVTQS